MIAIVLVVVLTLGICCYVRSRRESIFGKGKNGKVYQPLSRSDFEDMVQGVFDDDDEEEDEEGDIELRGWGEESGKGKGLDKREAVKTKLDFDGDFDFGEDD